jgi:hypothetical protein
VAGRLLHVLTTVIGTFFLDDCRAEHDCLYGADFVKGVPQGSYPFSRPSVSLFSNRDGKSKPKVIDLA